MDRVLYCDNCKREFESFDLDKGKNGKGFGFVVKEGDIEVLMSDLEYAFCCFTEPNPVRENDWQYWCVNCVEAVNGEE